MPCFTTPKQLHNTCQSRHGMGTSRRGTLSSCLRKIISRLNHFNFRLRPAGLRPSCLTFRVTSACPMLTILVVDLPCQSGTFTHWNYRPCSAARPLIMRRQGNLDGVLVRRRALALCQAPRKPKSLREKFCSVGNITSMSLSLRPNHRARVA